MHMVDQQGALWKVQHGYDRGCRFSAKLKTTLVQIVPEGEAGVTLECCGEVDCGEVLQGLGEEALGIRKGWRVPLLLLVCGLAGYHQGLNQRLGFSRGQSEVGVVTSEFVKRRGLLTGCAGLARGDPSQKEVRQWIEMVSLQSQMCTTGTT